ncbi:DUF2927 domain-containing protein [Silicimonas sp. MF1-12-2]|uniref:DUF2927 domain-containing protein n=1 Tax=Silicimonas sp. MF1-12-2 TaxID=3384793 RepID=UPI0039B67F0B
MKRFFFGVLFVFPIVISGAIAQESVKSKGRLSDPDFYRAVACAAPPGGKCQKPLVRWGKTDAMDLTVRVVRVEDGVTRKRSEAAQRAIQNAIAQITGVNSGVRLRQITSGTPKISIVLAHDRVAAFDGAPRSVDEIFLLGGATGLAEVFAPRGGSIIQMARVTVATDVDDKALTSVFLEEIVQSLGLLTDIHNRYYHNRSIFSETGSNVRKLKGQDAKAIQMHYPP